MLCQLRNCLIVRHLSLVGATRRIQLTPSNPECNRVALRRVWGIIGHRIHKNNGRGDPPHLINTIQPLM
ncbi:hypothetical protein MC7420_6747 [Coleofasciculus chthonoplastes PCC 7420]|uniref:Uncharacterized protein n=1 Tax=Coleofasciculus chthonoplastes PCC 7420 TaxID=118168 RepID=B4VWI0_9CYAN|nr:hypothetical protein MC7420_6747 [Coleofasciculus chthonoplastes PCC 7420]